MIKKYHYISTSILKSVLVFRFYWSANMRVRELLGFRV